MKSLDIGLAYNLRPSAPPPADAPVDAYEEFDGEDTVEALERTLAALGHRPRRLGCGRALLTQLIERPPELVFNLTEGQGSRSREAQVPAVCEMLGIVCTGSDPLTMALALDKALAKHVLRSAGVASAEFRVVGDAAEIDAIDLPYPLFVKPVGEGSSMGIRSSSRVADRAELRREASRCLAHYRQPVLVERYLPGAELTVAIRGRGAAARVLGAMGIEPADGDARRFVYGLESKRDYKSLVRYHIPPRLSSSQLEDACSVALRAYRVLGCRDLARVDVRFDDLGRANFIEINPLPGLNPVTGDICLIADGVGLGYAALIESIVSEAMQRAASCA